MIIKIREYVSIKHLTDPKSFAEYSSDKKDVYPNTDGYNPNKKCRVLIVFNDMFAKILSNEKIYTNSY